MARKTFDVKEFKEWVNDKLSKDYISNELKIGMCASLSHILHETGNYNGFGFVYTDDQRPMITNDQGKPTTNPNWTEDHEYRRIYY